MYKQKADTYCDRSGKLVEFKDTRKQWDGLLVWKNDWDPRQPQDFSKVVQGEGLPKHEFRQPADVFVNSSTIAGIVLPYPI